MKRVTIKDVALEAGVSLAAVSRVFTNTAGSSARMREKVQKAAKDLGYRPSMLAKGLVGQRTNLITLVSGRMADPFDALFLDRLSERLAQLKMRLLLASSALQGPNESGFFQALDYQSDAVIVSAGTMPLDHSSACVRNGLPVLLMGRIVEQPGVDCALADNGNGARMAAELLLRTGCRRLGYLGRGGETFSDRERFKGFADALSGSGTDLKRYALKGTPDNENVFRTANTILSDKHRPDGIFCSSDSLAFGVIEAARALGISIPDDLSVIGFNNVPQAGWRSFQLTTIDLSVNHCIETGIELLNRRLENSERCPLIRRIPVELVVRGTTRQIPAGGKES